MGRDSRRIPAAAGPGALSRRIAALTTVLVLATACTTVPGGRGTWFSRPPSATGVWINALSGEALTFDELVADLATVDLVLIGERHTIDRHHELQERIVRALAERGRPLALGLEMMESRHQPTLDRYAAGGIDFNGLVRLTDWESAWSNCRDYRGVLEAAREAGAAIVALNAPAETIRAVARGGGVASLPADLRAQLPDELQLDDPAYERWLNVQMLVHGQMQPVMLRGIVEAQIARDEAMADAAARFLQSPAGEGRQMVVLTGSGHVNYGFGTAGRLLRRLPGRTHRVVILSESRELDAGIEAMGGHQVEVRIEDLRAIGRAVGDYVHVVAVE